MMRWGYLLSIALLLGSTNLHAVAKGKAGGFDQVSCSDNLSQLIRSNSNHYWNFMAREADLRDLKPYLSYAGVVTGDPHMGNFAPMPVKNARGVRSMMFLNVDFDDAGHAPFVLDFVRYVVTVKSFSEETKKRELEEAYISGLRGKALPAPPTVQQFLNMSVAEYDKLAAAYLAKHTDQTGFILEDGKVELYSAKISRAKIEKLFPEEKVVDLAMRPKVRGGSAGETRIWVLVEGKSGRRIMELKQQEAPGVAKYQPQPPTAQWLKEVQQTFWPGLDTSAYTLEEIDGDLFWLRQKHVSLIDIPYSSAKAEALSYVHALAIYDANVLGLIHGRQAQSRAYLAAIEKDEASFHAATKALVTVYLEKAMEALKGK